MKQLIFLIVILIIFSSCKDDDYSVFCNFNKSENAPNIVGKWNVERDYHAYRISGELALEWTEPQNSIYKFCENGYGMYKFEDEEKLENNPEVTWSFHEENQIIVNTNIMSQEFGVIRAKDTLEIIIDEEDYQFWVDTTYRYNHLIQDNLMGIQTWKLTRR